MSIASRFSVGVHILTLLDGDEDPTHTSEWMAGSIGVNPVVVRSVTGLLRRANLVRTKQGVPGTRLAKPLEKITLLDVYRAVESDGELFTIHAHPNPKCPVGAHIQSTLESHFGAAQKAMEDKLESTTLDTVVKDLKEQST